MINRKFFFDTVRATLFGGKILKSQTEGLTAILDTWDKYEFIDDRWLAYMLATTFHETDRRMQPIEEYGKGYRKDYGTNLTQSRHRYKDTKAIFYGRGFVQLTWYENYQRAGRKLGIDLLQHPELALKPDIAARIMFEGMTQGWFTGRKLEHYFNPDKDDWVNARRIINKLDRAQTIADYGLKFYAALSHRI